MGRFSEDEVRRYSRQILLREVGGRGQERLRAAEVHLKGSGLVAEVAASYLQRAGVAGLLLDASATPGITRIRAAGAQLFAIASGAMGQVGWGCPCAVSLIPDDGEAAFATGSALALETLKLLLGLVSAPAHAAPRPMLRLDLSGETPPALHEVPPCRCGTQERA